MLELLLSQRPGDGRVKSLERQKPRRATCSTLP